MIPGKSPIYVPRGGTLIIDFDAKDPATGLPIEFGTIYDKAKLIVRNSWMRKPGKIIQFPALLELNTETADIDQFGGINLNGQVVEIRYPYTLTEVLKFSRAAYELELIISKVDPTPDIIDKFMYGAFDVTGELG